MQNIKTLILGLITLSLLASCASQGELLNLANSKLTRPNTVQSSKPIIKIAFQCSTKLLRPAVFREEPLKVLVYDGSANYSNIPAEMVWHETKIQVEPARYAQETKAAEYEEIQDLIEVERTRSELYASPAKYKSVVREVLTKPHYQRWKAGCLATANESCLEHVAAELTKMSTQVVHEPAQISQRSIPAKIIAIKRKKLIKPGQGIGEILPARYATIKLRLVSKPWKITSSLVPSKYETLTIHRKLRDEQVVSMPVVCAEALSAEHIIQIQQALLQNGQTLTVSGSTINAIHSFQAENKLAIGAITLETLRKLGLA